jgi:hypothetical protein
MPKRRLLSTDNDNDLEMLLKEFAEEKPVEVPKEPVKTDFNFKKRKLNDFQLDLAQSKQTFPDGRTEISSKSQIAKADYELK